MSKKEKNKQDMSKHWYTVNLLVIPDDMKCNAEVTFLMGLIFNPMYTNKMLLSEAKLDSGWKNKFDLKPTELGVGYNDVKFQRHYVKIDTKNIKDAIFDVCSAWSPIELSPSIFNTCYMEMGTQILNFMKSGIVDFTFGDKNSICIMELAKLFVTMLIAEHFAQSKTALNKNGLLVISDIPVNSMFRAYATTKYVSDAIGDNDIFVGKDMDDKYFYCFNLNRRKSVNAHLFSIAAIGHLDTDPNTSGALGASWGVFKSMDDATQTIDAYLSMTKDESVIKDAIVDLSDGTVTIKINGKEYCTYNAYMEGFYPVNIDEADDKKAKKKQKLPYDYSIFTAY